MNRVNDEVISTQRRRGAPKDKGRSRRIWSAKEEEALLNGLKSLVASGWKCENGFLNGYLMQLEGHILHVFPNSDIRAEPHINSKIHVWKKQYATLISMMSKSGFGWDEGKYMITVEENSISDEHVKVDPTAKSMRFKLFPYFPVWREIFEKDRATGERAKDGKATADAVREEEAMETQDYYVPTADWNLKERFVSNDGDQTRAQMNIDPTTHLSSAPKPNYDNPKKCKKPQAAPEDRLLDMVSSFCQDANALLGTLTKVLQIEFGDLEKYAEVENAVAEIEGIDEN